MCTSIIIYTVSLEDICIQGSPQPTVFWSSKQSLIPYPFLFQLCHPLAKLIRLLMISILLLPTILLVSIKFSKPSFLKVPQEFQHFLIFCTSIFQVCIFFMTSLMLTCSIHGIHSYCHFKPSSPERRLVHCHTGIWHSNIFFVSNEIFLLTFKCLICRRSISLFWYTFGSLFHFALSST